MMRAPSRVAWLLLVLAATTAQCHVAKRQVDTSNISDDDLIACFAALAEGKECKNILSTPTPKPEKPGCRCVKQWECLDETGPSITTDTGILTLVNVRSICPESFETCCTNVNPNPTEPPPAPTPPNVQACGQLRPQGVSSTFVGFTEKQAQFGQFPWMAAVMNTQVPGTNGANVYVSGGSLIHPGVVLTAAHYMAEFVNNPGKLAVRLGEWDFKVPSEPVPHQEARVTRVALHPNFVPNQLTYDVALLFLDRQVPLGSTIGLVCLPEPFETYDSRECYGSGWGKDVFGREGKYQQILKSIKLPMVQNGQCQSALRNTRLGATFNLHKSFVCAGGQPGIDLCTGDGGSPLVCPKRDGSGYVQTGVVAWGIGCGENGIPGVYASVSEAVPWIGQELLTSHNFDVRRGPTGK